MKVSINHNVVSGPWGGGNRFVSCLADTLMLKGHEVSYSLDDDDIDIILIIDPRWRHPFVTFTPGAILRYLSFKNSDAIVVHRINECDERKNTNFMNKLLSRSNYCADFTVFVADWLSKLSVWQNNKNAQYCTILNGSDTRIFNSENWKPWDRVGPISFVTHHWSANWNKGFDIYLKIDSLLNEKYWREKIHFTYIGNLPKNISFKNIQYIMPLDGVELATEIKKHHAYLTASLNEPGGNHQNEGALCGLPLMFRMSGGTPQYCDGFGLSFTEADFEFRLEEFISKYESFVEKMHKYPHTAEKTMDEYINLFESLLSKRDKIIEARKLWRDPWQFIRLQFNI